MGAWLPIIVVAVTQIMSLLISVAGVIWQERARARSHCIQMETAASSGTVLCERLGNGTTLLVIPGTAGREQTSTVELISRTFREKSPR
jgi:hypothetical protein